MEVGGLDGGSEGIAEFDGFGRGFDGDFVFGFAEFLNLEGEVGGDDVGDLIDGAPGSEGCVFGDDGGGFDGAEVVGGEVFDFECFLAASVEEGEGAVLEGVFGFVGFEGLMRMRPSASVVRLNSLTWTFMRRARGTLGSRCSVR